MITKIIARIIILIEITYRVTRTNPTNIMEPLLVIV
jgi:hypothetical protein